MAFHLLCVITFLFSSCQFSTQVTLFEGDDCTAQTFNGTCTFLKNCTPEFQKVKSGKTPEMLCSYSGFDPIVCCPLGKIASTTENSLTDKENLSELISEAKCKEYSNFSYTSNSAMSIKRHVRSKTKRRTRALVRDAVKMVVGGTKSEPKQFPHMTAIGFYGNNQSILWYCGGTLISERFVLTAAHCTFSIEWGNAVWARVGDLNLNKDNDDANPRNYQIIERIKHPDYKKPEFYHDIALMKLEKDVRFDDWARPACLPNPGINQDPEKAIAAGWGVLDWTDEKGSEDLMQVSLEIVSNAKCNEFYKDDKQKLSRGVIKELQICAGQEGKDTCQGDSGGPLMVRNQKHINMHTVIGITSLGKICGGIVPGVYTRVSHYITWIENIIWPKS